MPAARTCALAALPLAFLLFTLGWPLSALLWQGAVRLDVAVLQDMAQDDYLQWRLLWSILQALASSAAALVLGVPVGWVLARFEFRGRSAVLRLMMLPFVMPTLLAALGVLAVLGPRGLTMQWFGLDGQGTPWLLLYGNVFFNLCVVVRASLDGFSQFSAAHRAAARTLGASPWRVFWRLEWPLAKPWVLGSATLVAMYCLSGFGLALILGGQQFSTLEVEIYTLVAHELKLAQGGALALLCTALGGLAAWAHLMQTRNLPRNLPQDAVHRMRIQRWPHALGLLAALWVLFAWCAAPLLALVWHAMRAPVWAVLAEPSTALAIWNTVRFSAMALLLALGLGLLHALAARHSAVLRWAVWLPFIVSPVALAFGVLLAYPLAAASLPVLLAAYALLAYPFVAVAAMNALDALPVSIVQAASTLGASPWRIFIRITWPLIQPAVRRGLAFAAASCLGEFAVSLFLSRPEWMTLTTLIYQYLSTPGAANLDAAGLLACVLMALSFGAFCALDAPHRPTLPQHHFPTSASMP